MHRALASVTFCTIGHHLAVVDPAESTEAHQLGRLPRQAASGRHQDARGQLQLRRAAVAEQLGGVAQLVAYGCQVHCLRALAGHAGHAGGDREFQRTRAA